MRLRLLLSRLRLCAAMMGKTTWSQAEEIGCPIGGELAGIS